MSWGFIGKVPCEGDFVRHGASDPLAVAALRWVADAVAEHPAWLRSIPGGGVRFVFVAPDTLERQLVGVLVASRDRVGREFPLLAFHALTLGPRAAAYPAVPLAWNGALTSARRALGEDAATRTPEAIASALRAVPSPSADDVARMYERSSTALEGAPRQEFHERLFSDGSNAPHYAYHTVRTATAQRLRGRAPALVCPVALQTDLFAWLELVKRLAPAGASPTGALWTSGAASRLVVCLSDMPSAALAAATLPSFDSPRIWPLTTPSDAARGRAHDLIQPLLPRTDATLMSMLRALSHRSP